MENYVVVLLLQTPLPFQLRSAHFSPAEEWYSEADTKAVRSLNILMINVYLTYVLLSWLNIVLHVLWI
jgi:hypothetical protein